MPADLSLAEHVRRDLDGTHPLVVIETDDEQEMQDLLFAAIPAEVPARSWTAIRGLGDARIEGRAIPDTENPTAALAWLCLEGVAERSFTIMHDLSPHLDEPRAQRGLKELVQRMRGVFGAVVLVGRSVTLPPDLEAEAHRRRVPAATPKELEDSIREGLRDLKRTRAIEISLKRSTLDAMIRGLRGLTRRQAARVIAAAAAEDDRFVDADLERVLLLKRNACADLGGVLEFVQAPVSMDEVGGLARLKAWLAARHLADAESAAEFGLKAPRGMLLLGVQGAGKSLAAKAVATAWKVPLLRLDAGALYDKFIGESERRLRESLAQAERMAPAVLWIDEIEKGFASASGTSTDGGLSRRMFGTLLTWMQEHQAPLFIAATANDIASLPPELLRKGRFDEVFFVDLPGLEVRAKILEIHLRRRKRDLKPLDLAAVAAATEGFSGAELEAGVEASLRRAFAEGKRPLATKDLLEAFRESPPLSVVMAERIAETRAWASARCVPAD